MELINGATTGEVIGKKTPIFNAHKRSAEVALGEPQSEGQRDVLKYFQLPACPELRTDGFLPTLPTVNSDWSTTILADRVTPHQPISTSLKYNNRTHNNLP